MQNCKALIHADGLGVRGDTRRAQLDYKYHEICLALGAELGPVLLQHGPSLAHLCNYYDI
jgi:hypothetical protein